MKCKALTTAALLAAAMTMPTFAQEVHAQAVQVEHDVVVVQDEDGVEARVLVVRDGDIQGGNDVETVRARVIMMDQDGNVIELDGDAAPQVNRADNIHIEMLDMGVPGVELVEGDDGEVRVFLRQIGGADVVQAAPVNPPMVEATYLGLNCEPLDFDTAALLLVAEGTGLSVTFVAPDSPAGAAGLEAGDTLLKMGDQVLINPEQLAVLIRTHEAGDAVTLHVIRDGEDFELEAELGTNTVPQLGPGGRNLHQFWNVERQGNAGQGGQFRVLPEGLAGNIARINPNGGDIAAQMEMIQRLLAEHGQAMPDIQDLQDQAQQMRERMQLHQKELQRMFEELDIQPGEFNQQQNFDMPFNGVGNAAMQIVWNDGEHTIQISGDGEGSQTLNITDTEGNELFDGPMPQGDALNELPQGVGDKVREMTEGNHFEFDIEVAPAVEEVAPVEPAAPQEADVPTGNL